MSPEEKVLLEKLVTLTEDNNKILRKMQAAARRAMVYSFLKMVIIVAPLVLGFYLLQPYMESAQSALDQYKELLAN